MKIKMITLKKKIEIPEKHSQEFFHMVIVGRSGCGKTKLLLDLLNSEFKQKFNAIFLICPTFLKNQTYDSFWCDEKFYVLPFHIDCLEESITMARKEAQKYFRSLIIFDDVIGTKVLNSRVSNFVNLLIGGGHDGISTITLTQQLNSISKPARDQLTKIITFYNPDGDDRKIMFDKYLCDITKEERKEIIKFLREKEYSKMEINILKGTFKLLD